MSLPAEASLQRKWCLGWVECGPSSRATRTAALLVAIGSLTKCCCCLCGTTVAASLCCCTSHRLLEVLLLRPASAAAVRHVSEMLKLAVCMATQALVAVQNAAPICTCACRHQQCCSCGPIARPCLSAGTCTS